MEKEWEKRMLRNNNFWSKQGYLNQSGIIGIINLSNNKVMGM